MITFYFMTLEMIQKLYKINGKKNKFIITNPCTQTIIKTKQTNQTIVIYSNSLFLSFFLPLINKPESLITWRVNLPFSSFSASILVEHSALRPPEQWLLRLTAFVIHRHS